MTVEMSMEELWAELVTTALLGTDRRDPPELDGSIAEVVADSVRSDPSSRMLAAVAACTAVRRAGVRPAAPADPLAPPEPDDRPPCVPAAVDRWQHITRSWPVLEDEWMLSLIRGGWRLAPELVPAALQRHRRDPIRRARVLAAAGSLAPWLIDHVPDLGPSTSARTITALDTEAMAELPELPIPPDLASLVDRTGAESGGAIAVGLEDGTFGEAHRAVLVNLVARCAPDALADVEDVLRAVDSRSPGHPLAATLADLALTRRRMLDELSAPGHP
ncbi:DUF5691 domain-containing protein [Ilumatobacter nonamiensis]|uniref:DUF5691 domain-containing protein n=1 Tax=Ilumatobacter nonamiensis TaxID=467093 RepID=UPI00034A2FF9|nr:hypothetical protein [Ilumatobacter nonamiensis]